MKSKFRPIAIAAAILLSGVASLSFAQEARRPHIDQPQAQPAASTTSSANYKSTKNRTQFLESKGRKIAYRSVGQGTPIILALRFRGVLDSWDPAFLDSLSKNYKVIIFDYSGIGNSTGKRATTMPEMVDDIFDLADGLKLDKFVLGGWSMGGFATQQALVRAPGRITHALLIGTAPAEKKYLNPSKEFFEASAKPVMNLEDETVLLFDPSSPISTKAAKLAHSRMNSRKIDKSPVAPSELFDDHRLAVGDYMEDKVGSVKMLRTTKTPILVIAGDKDPGSPPITWFKESGNLPTAQIIVLPQAGHGPQQQYPELSASYIHSFLKGN
jgi:pimeloyl-ACP methyl ester carboxylesterase